MLVEAVAGRCGGPSVALLFLFGTRHSAWPGRVKPPTTTLHGATTLILYWQTHRPLSTVAHANRPALREL